MLLESIKTGSLIAVDCWATGEVSKNICVAAIDHSAAECFLQIDT